MSDGVKTLFSSDGEVLDESGVFCKLVPQILDLCRERALVWYPSGGLLQWVGVPGLVVMTNRLGGKAIGEVLVHDRQAR